MRLPVLLMVLLPSYLHAQQLTRIAEVATPGIPSGLAVSSTGTAVYLPSFAYSKLQVYDVRKPASPTLFATLSPSVVRVRDVLTVGDRAYVIGYGTAPISYSDVKAYDLSDPLAPASPGYDYFSLDASSPITVAASTSLVSVCSQAKGTFQVLDKNLHLLSTVNFGANVYSKATINGTAAYVYVAGAAGKMSIYDLSTPSAPVLKGTFNGYISTISGKLGFSLGTSKLDVYDVSAPLAPVLLSSTTISDGSLLAASGNTVFIVNNDNSGSSQLQAFDVSTPTAPRLVSTIGIGGTVDRLVSNGQYAYLLCNNFATLRVYSIGVITATVKSTPALLTLYPNPAHQVVTIKAGTTAGPVTLYDMAGRVCLSVPALPASNQLDVHGLRPGLYLARVGNAMQKLQIE